eukprot:1938389-Pyramimonas_sp.AAC.1
MRGSTGVHVDTASPRPVFKLLLSRCLLCVFDFLWEASLPRGAMQYEGWCRRFEQTWRASGN